MEPKSTRRVNLNPWRLWAVIILVTGAGAWLVYEIGTIEPTEATRLGWTVEAHRIFNLIEGVVWLGVAATLLCKARRRDDIRRPAIVAGIFFALFGVSDFIEMATGSWFEPAWLLVWNIACVIGLLLCLVWQQRLKRSRSSTG